MDIIVLAAGSGERFIRSLHTGQTQIKKQFATISGRSLIAHTLYALANASTINKIVLVLPKQLNADEQAEIDRLSAVIPDRLITAIGGKERSDSVQFGLNALERQQDISPYLAIHDCARPFITDEILRRLLTALTEHPEHAILPVLEMTDTIKQQDQNSISTIDRRQLMRAQTPQCFLRSAYHSALNEAKQTSNIATLTDDCSLYEVTGRQVLPVTGDRRLEKITTADDLPALYHYIVQQETLMWEYVTGTGYDVHRFDPEVKEPLMICGVATEHECGVDAHSDGDVGLHAICDAICGAMSDGDIGSHFPPTDDAWKDKSSHHFLRHIAERARQQSAQLMQLDVTIICERPKITPYREQMRASIAEICDIDIRRVSVKATTSERLGFTGRKEGIAAMASASIRRPAIGDEKGSLC